MQRAPNAKLRRVADPATEPITLDQAKQFLRVEVADDDDLITDLIQAARIECETLVDRSFLATDWELSLDHFPASAGRPGGILPALAFGSAALGSGSLFVTMEGGAIRLPMPPLIRVASIGYLDTGGTLRTLDLSTVTVSDGTPGQIAPKLGQIFPLTFPALSAVKVTYSAGYGADASAVPGCVKVAIRFLVAHYYEHRTSQVEVPEAVDRMLNPVRWGSY